MPSYLAIDLKSFYASVECRERGLDPMTTNLVVADGSRTEKTICLAVSPSLKSYGISGRARLFEVVQKVTEINTRRQWLAPGRKLCGASSDDRQLKANPSLALEYIVAPPRMAHYLEYSTRIYQVYLKYVAPEDIHIYSIDEVFIDVSHYMGLYGLTPRQLAQKILKDVLETTGITATAGIGTNLYLAKIAMDIVAKRMPADRYGVRIAELDELSYRRTLWAHRPLTDFWRIGRGYAKKLERHRLFTMGDIARCSLGGPADFYNEELLYRLFGIQAELLIDHAWGCEPCTLADIRSYQPENHSTVSGQVLTCPYPSNQAALVVREMTDALSLELVEKGLVTDQLVLTVGYDIENLKNPERRRHYTGPVTTDGYGRQVPKQANGSVNLNGHTSSTREMSGAVMELYNRIVDPSLLVRRMSVTANHLLAEQDVIRQATDIQLDLFSDRQAEMVRQAARERERRMQQALVAIRKRYGKNAVLKGMSYGEGATARERNGQIGGHRA